MFLRGIPETVDEAREIVERAATTTPNTQTPAHYPHSQVVALAQLVVDLSARVAELERKPKRGRPPKNRDEAVCEAHDEPEPAEPEPVYG